MKFWLLALCALMVTESALATCGDGTVNTTEGACDDGNLYDGDGCSSLCAVETNWTCTTSSNNISVCTMDCPTVPDCGDAAKSVQTTNQGLLIAIVVIVGVLFLFGLAFFWIHRRDIDDGVESMASSQYRGGNSIKMGSMRGNNKYGRFRG